MKNIISTIIITIAAALALGGCGYNKYLTSVESANTSRVAIVKEEQKAKVAEAGADEAGFNALKEGTKSADPVVAAISAAQLGTVLAVRAVRSQDTKSAAGAVVNPEKPTDPVDSVTRLAAIATGGFVAVRQSDNRTKVEVATISGNVELGKSHDAALTSIAGNAVAAVSALEPALKPGTVVTADNGATVNVSGTQSTTRSDTQSVTCTTGDAGSSGPAGNGASGTTGTATVPSVPGGTGGASGAAGAGGSNTCASTKPAAK
jgi:hypothetical protein